MATRFSQYAFKSTGGTLARTMPDRLAEEKNVRDFGAAGDGVSDDRVYIQRAFDTAIAQGCGVYFPAGTYFVTDSGNGSAINWNQDANFGFHIRAPAGTYITGSMSGYLINRKLTTPNNTRGPRVIEGLVFQNATGGGLRVGSSIGVTIKNCFFGCSVGTGLTTEDSPGVSSQAVLIENCHFAAGNGSVNSVGYVLGGSGQVINTNCESVGTGSIIYGEGISVDGSRCERCVTAFKLGVDSAGTDRGLKGFSLAGQEMEGVVTFIDFIGTVSGFQITGTGMTGHDASNAGLEGFNANSQYGIRIRANKAYSGEFVGCWANQWYDVGALYIEDYSAPKRAFLTFTNCEPQVGGGAGATWRIPASSVWPKFIECNSLSSSSAPPTGIRYTYANLPSGSDLYEGDEFDISDGSTATMGNTVTGGGANRVRVRWDSSNWICIGK